KAVRAALFETSLRVARTDFAEREEAGAVAPAVVELMDFLDEHAGHEQRFVFPELASFAPLLAAELEADHANMDKLQTEIRHLAHAVHGPSREDREENGRLLARALSLLVADQLRHLDREETEANAVACAHRTDAELAEIQARIHASMPPDHQARWIVRVIPALNPAEQAALLSRSRASMPPAAFSAMLGLAREALGTDRWTALARRLGLEVVAA